MTKERTQQGHQSISVSQNSASKFKRKRAEMCGQFFPINQYSLLVVYGISTTFGCVKIYIAQKLNRNSKRNHVYIILNIYILLASSLQGTELTNQSTMMTFFFVYRIYKTLKNAYGFKSIQLVGEASDAPSPYHSSDAVYNNKKMNRMNLKLGSNGVK